jgi:hypothetical protein
MLADCAPVQQALFECKRTIGLLPNQCYPVKYSGECDQVEYDYKKCISFELDPR